MGFYIPETMKNMRRWVVWKKNGQQKPPYSARTDSPASTKNATTWSDYETARLKYDYSELYSGIGFIMTDTKLFLLDIDNCIDENGEIGQKAAELLELFKGTYAEYSQSGNGLHIIGIGEIPRNYKGNGIELYAKDRYIAMTGNAIEAVEPANMQAALNELCKRYSITAAPAPLLHPEPQKTTSTEAEIIQRIERHSKGEEFKRLYYKAEYSYTKPNGEPDQSRADYRLIWFFVFNGATDSQIHSLFKQSALGQRAKATPEYIQRTIAAVRANTKSNKKTEKTQRTAVNRQFLVDTPSQKKYKRP